MLSGFPAFHYNTTMVCYVVVVLKIHLCILRFGSHGGTVGLPDGCMSLHDGCRDFHVRKSNKSLDCFTGKPLDFAKMAFKPHPDNFIGLDKAAKDKATSNTDTQMNTRGSLFLPISVSFPGCMRACVCA